MTRLLDEKTRTRAEKLAAEGRWYDALDLVQDQVEGAIDLGLVSREQMRADLELALLVARLGLGAAEYEGWQQALQCTEDFAGERGKRRRRPPAQSILSLEKQYPYIKLFLVLLCVTQERGTALWPSPVSLNFATGICGKVLIFLSLNSRH